jgi:hypothetical protein
MHMALCGMPGSQRIRAAHAQVGGADADVHYEIANAYASQPSTQVTRARARAEATVRLTRGSGCVHTVYRR